jgi:hypothetical protein
MSRESTPPAAREERRSRTGAGRVDRWLALGCAVVVTGTLLVGTAVVPTGLFPARGTVFELNVPRCVSDPPSAPWVATFPLWATVSFRWTATGGDVAFYTNEGPVVTSGLGSNGTGSFASTLQPTAFYALAIVPTSNGSCAPIVVTATVTYAV